MQFKYIAMSQSLMSPYWIAEHRTRRDAADRLHQIDYQFTKIVVSNPGNREGMVELIFYEARGDGNFYRSDWAGGRWIVSPTWQRHIRPDPSRVFGSRFITYGWFEVWMSRDDMTIDVSVSAISRSLVAGAGDGSGGLVESISQRTVQLVPKHVPIIVRFGEWMGFTMPSPLHFPPGTNPILDQDLTAMFRPEPPADD